MIDEPLDQVAARRTAPSGAATCTAFGSPLVPEVKIIMKVSIAPTSRYGVSAPAPSASRTAQSGAVTSTHRDAGEVEPLEQRQVLVVGEQDLAVRAAYVGRAARRRAGWC